MTGLTKYGFALWGVEIRWYAVCIVAGILLSYLFALRRSRLMGFPRDTAIDLVLVCMPAGLVGARLMYVVMEPSLFHSFRDVIDITGGGLAIYGGIIAGALAAVFYARAKKISYIALADLALPCVLLGQALGRWGNFFNGEAYGPALPAFLSFFPAGVFIEEDGLWHAAAFFYESLWCVLSFLFLETAFEKGKTRARGEQALGYILLYALERCAVEALRTDSLYLGSVRVSQLLSALMIGFAVTVLIIKKQAKGGLIALFALCEVLILLSVVHLIPAWGLIFLVPAGAAGIALLLKSAAENAAPAAEIGKEA